MRSLWITNDLPPRAGGIEQFVGNLVSRVHPASTVVLGPAQGDTARHDAAAGYTVVRATGPVVPLPSILRRARTLADAHDPDVVVLGASWPLGELVPALRRDPGVPVVALTHGLEAGLCAVGLGLLVRRATRGLAAVTTISDWAEDHLRPHVRAAHMARVPPGVDIDRFGPECDGAAMRRAWGVPPDAPLVGCISRFVRRKGQDALLAVWPDVLRRHPEAWLALVGTGPIRARLQRRAAGLAQVVMPGEVAWDDLPASHAALDVFAMPCRTRLLGTDVEGLGIVYLEAQACGVPVIAGRSGGAPEAVVPGETGLVVDGRDHAQLLRALDRLLGDDGLRGRLGRAGRRHAAARWSWTGIADRFREVLARAAG